VENEVPVRERPAFGVLPRQSHRDAFGEEPGEREGLGVAPVDTTFIERLRAAFGWRRLRIDVKPSGTETSSVASLRLLGRQPSSHRSTGRRSPSSPTAGFASVSRRRCANRSAARACSTISPAC
jgi:hypothetical protein